MGSGGRKSASKLFTRFWSQIVRGYEFILAEFSVYLFCGILTPFLPEKLKISAEKAQKVNKKSACLLFSFLSFC